ncbi:hypothetical protein [Flavobacterium aestuarii]|uniref:hypothetical protein n=1 Tax=Flavobacterium aestuarii TaxID=3149227 RepID=UPI0032B5B44D
MKKISPLLSALIFIIISSCSGDDSSSDSGNNLVLPKTITMTFPDFPSDNSKDVITYDGNKILTSVDENSKTVFTYDGNFIVKQVKFEIDNSGKEVKDVEVSYIYENGKLKIRTLKEEFSTEYPNGQYVYKTVYKYISDNQVSYIYYYVDPNTKNETKQSEGTLSYKDGNLVKQEDISTQYNETRTYEYDNKNNPLKKILGLNLLLNETGWNNNNVVKTTRVNSTFQSPSVYVSDYIYDDKGYPTKHTSFTSDGKKIEYVTEYTY